MNSLGIKEIGFLDCPGGGQVWVEGGFAFIGHMSWPFGTSIVDVRDPSRPRVIAELSMPENTHSHKVRAKNGLMLVNRERLGRWSEVFSVAGDTFGDAHAGHVTVNRSPAGCTADTVR